MTVSWLFLAVSLVGAWFTANALWPTRRWQVLAFSFFAGWFTAELAYWHLAWQVVATVVFVALGALDHWPGIVGLAITLVSWAGLVWIIVLATRSKLVVEDALLDGLGHDYRERIQPGRAERLARGLVRRQLVHPFRLRDPRVERVADLPYADDGHARHRLDVYRPIEGVERAPVLLQIHGGAWIVGDKGQQGLPLMLHLAAAGWVCVAPNYRLSPSAQFPAHLIDAKRALHWVREHVAEYGGDPEFVVVTGGSAGGHLAALLALTANDPAYQPGFEDADTSVAAAVPFYGVYDLAEVLAPRTKWGPGRRIGESMARAIMGTTVAEDPQRYADASPMQHVRPDAPPFLVVHGECDNLVPVTQARAFAAALGAVSREPVVYAEIPGAHHAFEIFYSVRAGNVVNGVDRFLAWVYSRSLERRDAMPATGVSPEGDAGGPADGGSGSSDPTTTARTEPSSAR